MSDGHFRSLQPCNGQYLLQKSASKKVLHFEKSRLKIPLVMGCPPPNDRQKGASHFIIDQNKTHAPNYYAFSTHKSQNRLVWAAKRNLKHKNLLQKKVIITKIGFKLYQNGH